MAAPEFNEAASRHHLHGLWTRREDRYDRAAATAMRGRSALAEDEPKGRAVSQTEILHPLPMGSPATYSGLRRMIALSALLGGVRWHALTDALPYLPPVPMSHVR